MSSLFALRTLLLAGECLAASVVLPAAAVSSFVSRLQPCRSNPPKKTTWMATMVTTAMRMLEAPLERD
jgi:hypothetical protein